MKVFKLLTKKDSYEDKLKRSIPSYTAEGSEASADFIRHEASVMKYDHRKMSNDLEDWPFPKYKEPTDFNKTASVEVITESELSGIGLKSESQVSGVAALDTSQEHITGDLGAPCQPQDVSPSLVQVTCSSDDLPSYGGLDSSNTEKILQELEHSVEGPTLGSSNNPFEDEEQSLPELQEEAVINEVVTEPTTGAPSLSLPSSTCKRQSVQELVERWESVTDKDAQMAPSLVEAKQRSNPFDDDDEELSVGRDETSAAQFPSMQIGCPIAAGVKAKENGRNMSNETTVYPQGSHGKSPKHLQEGNVDNPTVETKIAMTVGATGSPKVGRKSWSFNDRLKHKASFSDDMFPQFGSDRWFKRKYKYSQDWLNDCFPQQTSQLTATALVVVGLLLVVLLFLNLISV